MAYTNIDDPSAYFQIATYTGNGTDNTAITYDGNSDMQPDFLWFKLRSTTGNHVLFDSNRGVTKYIRSNTTAAETINGTLLKSFDTDGFTVGSNASTNYNNQTLVSWGWKVNGGTTSSNTDGTVTTTTQVNSDAGFSIVTWAGGGTGTLGHGLGETPDMWIIKNRDYAVSWAVGFSDSNILGGRSKYLSLNTSGAVATYNNLWGTSDAQINSTTIGAAGDRTINISGDDYVGYFFKAKQGYSKFSSYIGNGESLNGPFVYTGFKPAWVMIKNTETANRTWVVYDTKRRTFNPNGTILTASTTTAEDTNQAIDMLSNGFKVKPGALGSYGTSNINHSGQRMIYMAFAENPFTTSTGIPTTAR